VQKKNVQMICQLALYYCNKIPEIIKNKKGLFWVTVLEVSPWLLCPVDLGPVVRQCISARSRE
jgi:hypothetical protein